MKSIAEQTILVTGSSDGLGKQTALALARQGATVLLHGRDRQRLEATRLEIEASVKGARLETYLADFAELAQVRSLAQTLQSRHPHLDILVNNAGIGSGKLSGAKRELSRDGYELRFAVNYLAQFLLTRLLLPVLRQSAPVRIINVGSIGQSQLNFDDIMLKRRYDPMNAYQQSKLALVMFTFDLAEELKREEITVNCVHPASLMNTKMVYEAIDYTLSTIEDGLRSVMYLATSPALNNVSGKYFDQQQEARAHHQAYDLTARRRLRQLSEQLTELVDEKANSG